MKIKRVAVLTGGGDCPGLNAAIRAITKTAINDYGMSVFGFKDGYAGLIEGRHKELSYDDVSGILDQGGTILGTSNRANPFQYWSGVGKRMVCRDVSKQAIHNFHSLGLQCLFCIGGDGTLSIASRLHKKGIPCIGLPKTIDNDLGATDVTFGFDSALATATEAIDKIHTTAESHHRVMLIEVMGRYAGWIALYSGIAGGGDIILIPEIPYKLDVICRRVKERHGRGRRFSIIVISEGARPKGGKMVVKKVVKDSPDPIRLGGVSRVLADEIEKWTGLETRVTILGHLQRGGSPTAADRILATRSGSEAVRLAVEGKFGRMVGVRGNEMISSLISEAVANLRRVKRNSSIVRAAKAVGTCFGI